MPLRMGPLRVPSAPHTPIRRQPLLWPLFPSLPCALRRKDLPSFARGLFEGRVNAAAVFPYPDVITDDARESLSMMVESTSKFFTTVRRT